jgi:hypothetical protein
MLLSALGASAQALVLSPRLEILRVPAVGAAWQTVNTQNSYTSPVVVCSYTLPTAGDNEAIQRVRNVASDGFELRIQRPANSSAVTASDTFCLVAEAGDTALPPPDGRLVQAATVLSNGTNGSARGWGVGGANGAEDVSGSVSGAFPAGAEPLVLGQVMTFNDADFSAFWSFDCDNRRNPAFSSGLGDGICVGKHVGMIGGAAGDRANETLGYILIDDSGPATGAFEGINYRVELGPNSIRGTGNSPPYSYNLGGSFDFAVVTKAAENGGNGGWAVLFGSDPLAGNQLDLAIEEETVAGDTSRLHIDEQVYYWAVRGTDRGDAPASYGNASHRVTGLLSLGSLASGDADAELPQPSANADADDLALLDDEDAVTFRSPAGSGDSIFADVTYVNRTGGSVTLCAWLDVPGAGGMVDGNFDSSDGQCRAPGPGSGTETFQWSGLPGDAPYSTFARFRISSSALGTGDASGFAGDGEVEDYPVSFDFQPTAVLLGAVALEALSLETFYDQLQLPELDDSALAALLQGWNLLPAAAPPAREAMLAALRQYLDPDADGQVAVLSWSTLEERGTLGFYVERQADGGLWERINRRLLPALIPAPLGGEYRLVDPRARSGHAYRYRLIEQEARGVTREYGPFTLTIQ